MDAGMKDSKLRMRIIVSDFRSKFKMEEKTWKTRW